MDERASVPPMDDGRTPPHRPPLAARQESPFERALPIYYALLLGIVTVAGLYLAMQLKHVVVLLFISALFAAAIDRPATWLERLHIPRAVAALMLYLLSLAVIVAIGWLVLPPLVRQIAVLADDVPSYLERYRDVRDRYEDIRAEYPALGPFENQAAGAGVSIVAGVTGRLTRLPTTLFGVFLDLLSIFVISLLLVTSGERLVTFALTLVHPRRRAHTRRVLDRMWLRLGHYLRAKLMVMGVIGAITYVALRLIGVPYPLLLAVVVGIGEAIPRAGPWIARIPLLAVAALEGWTTAAVTFGASVVIENAKGYVISPFIEGDQLDIHPLLVFIAVLIGAALLGPAGAFIAVPVAAMVQVLFEEVIIPWRLARIGEEAA